MVNRNKKDLNALFGKNLVQAAQPDDFWVLPNEMIGFELECEDFDNADEAHVKLRPEWKMKGDGSLRNGLEWVLNGPHSGAKLRGAINKLFPNKGFKYSMSERTSTHVHINMSDGLTLENLRAMFALIYIIEPAIFRWADENRKWCSYCCPLTDMSPERLAAILNEDDNQHLVAAFAGVRHEDKYYGFNIKSFPLHGTVEFRYFPCTNQKTDAIAWIQFVMEVKKAALSYDNVSDLLDAVDSPAAVNRFMRKHFTVNADNLLPRLDVQEAVTRASALSALLEVEVKDVAGSRRYNPKVVRSHAFTKMLKNVFKWEEGMAAGRIEDPRKAGVLEGREEITAEERRRMYAYWDAKYQNAANPQIAAQLKLLRDQLA